MTTMPRVAMLQRVSSSTSRPPEPMRDPQPWSQRRAGGVVSGAGRGRCSPKFSRVAAAVRRSPSSVSRSGPYGPCRIRSWPARREAAAVADNLGGRWLLADESSRRGEAIPRKTRSDLPGDSARRAVLAGDGWQFGAASASTPSLGCHPRTTHHRAEHMGRSRPAITAHSSCAEGGAVAVDDGQADYARDGHHGSVWALGSIPVHGFL